MECGHIAKHRWGPVTVIVKLAQGVHVYSTQITGSIYTHRGTRTLIARSTSVTATVMIMGQHKVSFTLPSRHLTAINTQVRIGQIERYVKWKKIP